MAFEIDQCQGEIHVGDAVAERMVGLDDQADLLVDEPIHEPHLPQRPGAVERQRLQPTHQRRQLFVVSRSRQRGESDVVLDVEVVVVDPDRAPLFVGHVHDPLPQTRDAVQAAFDVPAQLAESHPPGLVAQRRTLEHRERSDVLRFVRRLDAEERRIGRCQSFVVHAAPPRAGRSKPVLSMVADPAVVAVRPNVTR